MSLTDAELSILRHDLESDRVERKASASDRTKVRQAICAFANDLPDHNRTSVIFVGVHDDGRCAGLAITDELLRTLADMRSNGNILPFPVMSVQKRRLDDCDTAVVLVEPAEYPPVRFNGRVWVRVGPRRAQATAEEERRLAEKRRAADVPVDRRPVRGAAADALDLSLFQHEYLPAAVSPEVLADNRRTVQEQLAALHFLDLTDTPNTAALLVFGKDPRRWIPGAYVQFLRLDGDEITDPIRHQKEIDGALPRMLQQLDEVLETNISTATDGLSGGVRELRQPDYPIVALQQLARNAVLHRTYESTHAPVRIYWFQDRIEIHSPGGLYGQVNEESFGQPGSTDYRNPLLAESMKVLGFVQRFGLGIPASRRELDKNGNPPPEFEFRGGNVLAIIRRRP